MTSNSWPSLRMAYLISLISSPMISWSRPVRARGLKLLLQVHPPLIGKVAPRVGAWVETSMAIYAAQRFTRRAPHGCAPMFFFKIHQKTK